VGHVSCKHAVIGLTKEAEKEVGDGAIQVTAATPGDIYTPLILKAQGTNLEEGTNNLTAIKRMGMAEDIAVVTVSHFSWRL